MFYRLPPAGDRSSLQTGAEAGSVLDEAFSGYGVRWYGSGTMALAATVVAAMERRRARRSEVVLPAYGCPDLISAVQYAGATPVLVDLERQRPWMDKEQLIQTINANTVAVVAVHFLGIRERVLEIRELLHRDLEVF